MKIDVEEVLKRYESARIDCPQCGKRMIMLDDYHYCFDCKIPIPYIQSSAPSPPKEENKLE